MKVLFLSPYIYHPYFKEFQKNKTGFGMMVASIAKSVSKCGNEVLCVTHTFTQEGKDEGIKFLKHSFFDVAKNIRISGIVKNAIGIVQSRLTLGMKLRWFFYFVDSGFVKKTILKEKPDVIHIHGLGIGTYYYIDICEQMNIPYLVTAHGLIKNAPEATYIDKKIEKSFFANSEKNKIPVSVISSGIKNRLINDEYYGLVSGDSVEVIPNGIEIQQLGPFLDVRKEYSIGNKKVIVSVGSVCEGKNQIQLVRAIDLLPTKQKENVIVFIIGKISNNYPIRNEIERLNLNDNIILLGFLPFDQLSDYYRAADLVVMPSKEEGFGLSLVEGFVYGTPCLAFSDLDVVLDIYNDSAMSLCNVRTDEALAASIEVALKKKWNSEWIKEYSKRFSLERMRDEYIKLYKNVIDSMS